nr:N-acetylglucosamine-6-phosphate deacetylase [Neobacillus sp. Marseille-Q6967]
MNQFLIKGKNIYTENGRVNGAILVEGTKIKKIVTNSDEISAFRGEVFEVGENPVIPGLIDVHIHGGGGWTIEDGDINTIKGFMNYLPSIGVTAYKPSIGTGTSESIKQTLEEIAEIISAGYEGSKIIGIHMEGPFLNPAKKGAYNPKNLLTPSIELMKEFIEKSGNHITHVTLAPELQGSDELIAFLINKDILVSGGHTDATFAETVKGIDQGVRLSNHTCNAQKSIHHREPGALGAYLLDDRVDCELICDFIHVHPRIIELVIKLKSVDKVCMISDQVMVAGLEPGKYKLLGHEVDIDQNGWSRLEDGTIAGSTMTLLYGMKNIVSELGYSMEDAVKMASYNPARVSGVLNHKGSIREGKDADLVVMDENFKVCYTFIEGKLAFSSEDGKDVLNPERSQYML